MSATIYSLSFSLDSSLLCVSSDTGTIHIYKVDMNQAVTELNDLPHRKSSGSNQYSTTSSIANFVTSYLPGRITELWDPMRHFAFAKLPQAINSNSSVSQTTSIIIPHNCCLNTDHSKLLVATADGFFYQYQFDSVNGGECKLELEYLLLPKVDDVHVTTNFQDMPVEVVSKDTTITTTMPISPVTAVGGIEKKEQENSEKKN